MVGGLDVGAAVAAAADHDPLHPGRHQLPPAQEPPPADLQVSNDLLLFFAAVRPSLAD